MRPLFCFLCDVLSSHPVVMFGISDIHVERRGDQPPYISLNIMLLESWNLERVPELPDILDEWMGSM